MCNTYDIIIHKKGGDRLTEKRKRFSSNPKNITVSIRVSKEEKQELDDLADRLGLTLTDTLKEGLKALDEKYRLLKK